MAGSGAGIKNVERAFTAAGGVIQPGFPATMQGLDFLGGPIVADVTGDGAAEIVNGGDSLGRARVHADRCAGTRVPEVLQRLESVGAVSRRPALERAHRHRDRLREGYVFAWQTPGVAAGNNEWWHAAHDERNTGDYGVDTRPPGIAAQRAVVAHRARDVRGAR